MYALRQKEKSQKDQNAQEKETEKISQALEKTRLEIA